MAKKTINLGTGELTGDGESIRSAFDKINDNFDELYTQDANDVVLSSINASLIPDTDVAYDLGSATNRFRDLYLSGSTIDLGGTTLSVVGGTLQIGGTDIKDVVTAAGVDYSEIQNTPTIPSFNQDLNTTDNVTFNTVTTPNLVLDGDVTTLNELFIDGGAQAIGIKSQVSIVLDGDVTFQNGTVSGFAGSVDITGGNRIDLDTDNGFYITNTDINTYGLTVAYTSNLNQLTASGAVSLASTLSVTGDTTLASNLNVGGDSSVTGTLNVTGNTALAGNASIAGDLAVTGNSSTAGNESVLGTFDVTGNATLSSDVTVGGNLAIAGDSSITGNNTANILTSNTASNFNGTLSVVGVTRLYDDLIIDGGDIVSENSAYFFGNLECSNITNLQNNEFASDNLTLSAEGSIVLNGNVSLGTVAGQSDFYGEIEFNNGSTSFQAGNSVDFNCPVDFNGTVDFSDATVDWNPIVASQIQANGLPNNTRFSQGAPATSIGIDGDLQGAVTFDSSYIYYCTANYDGSTNIWKRVAWSGDTW